MAILQTELTAFDNLGRRKFWKGKLLILTIVLKFSTLLKSVIEYFLNAVKHEIIQLFRYGKQKPTTFVDTKELHL